MHNLRVPFFEGANRMNIKILRGIVLCIVVCIAAVSSVYAAPARVSAKPVDEHVIKVYAYRVEPLVTMDDNLPGFLVEVSKEIVEHPEMDVVVEISPVAVLMKYSLIQSVGVSAIGTESDFSQTELKDLIGIPLFEVNGKVYSLYFNTLNPQSQQLYETAVQNFECIKDDGTFDQLQKKYKLN